MLDFEVSFFLFIERPLIKLSLPIQSEALILGVYVSNRQQHNSLIQPCNHSIVNVIPGSSNHEGATELQGFGI